MARADIRGPYVIDADGAPIWQGSAPAGSSVTLTCELPVIVLIANTAHPLDPREEFSCGRLEVLAWRDRATEPTDNAFTSTPERRRAYTNTTDYLTARGLS